MVFCNKCGKENKDFTKFCTGCGNNILPAIETSTVKEEKHILPAMDVMNNESICHQCGKQNKPNTKFCISCGNKLVVLSQPAKQNESVPIPQTQKTENLCPRCGKPNKESAKFCIGCGDNLALSKQESTITNLTNDPIEKISGVLNIPAAEDGKSNEVDFRENIIPHYENKTAENNRVSGLNEEHPKNADRNFEADIPVRETIFAKENNPNLQESYIQDKVVEIDEEEFKDSGITLTTEDGIAPDPKSRRKKILFLTGGLLLLVALASVFLFVKMPHLFADKKAYKNEQTIQPKEEPKPVQTNIIPVKDSLVAKINPVDSVITTSAPIIEAKATEPIATPVLKDLNKPDPAIMPTSPTLQMAINDLTGQGISKDLVFTKNAKVLSYDISKKNMQQCNVIITFKLENSDVKYTATLIYKNRGGEYIYENNTSYFKTLPLKEKEPPPAVSSVEHTVKNDLFNYLSSKKSFGGIAYNSMSEVTITKINGREYYAESGNTSYMVELTINNISTKCQVNYTIDGKFYVNPLR